MEASSGISKTSTGAGEVRRIHIVYFLSHNLGRFEHPHLIRVHHLNRNGVYLRDVKRWLADLRGKDMPKAFAWSYKRRYKNGYVWQDLLDDDLITPISDNEYVLKGSEIFVPPANSYVGESAYGEKTAASLLMKSENDSSQVENTEVELVENKAQDHEQIPLPNQICNDTTPRKTSSSEISQESPVFSSEISTATDDSINEEEEEDACQSNNSIDQEQIDNKVEQYSSFYSNLLSRSMKNQKKKKNSSISSIEKVGTPSSFSSLSSSSSSTSSSQATFAKSTSYSRGTSKILRNLMTCGAVDTNDSALVPQRQKCNNKHKPIDEPPADRICKGGELGGSARVFGTPWDQLQQKHHIANPRKSFDGVRGSKKQHNGFGNPKVVSPAHKPVAAPICSQCGKSFRPEKLHSHMKSCRGLKALTKAASTHVEKTPSASHTSVESESEDGYFLTN